jgi:uncharacterized membrane protein
MGGSRSARGQAAWRAMQELEKPRASRLVLATRIVVWLTAALLAALGGLFTIEGVTGSGDTAPELYIVPGVGGLVMAVVLALVGWSLRDSDTR